MQQENEQKDNFIDRTDALAKYYKCPLRDLPSKIGVSQGTFFNGRGKGVITLNTWSKIEQAEIKAGISNESLDKVASKKYVADYLIGMAENLITALKKDQPRSALAMLDGMKEPLEEASQLQRELEKDRIKAIREAQNHTPNQKEQS